MPCRLVCLQGKGEGLSKCLVSELDKLASVFLRFGNDNKECLYVTVAFDLHFKSGNSIRKFD